MQDLVRRLDRVLNPRTVAVVGDKKASGYMWLNNMRPFTGKLYSVQIDPNDVAGIEAMGVPNFARLTDIPDDIDLVVCAVPRQVALRVIADCVAKQVGGVQMFTSGFSETGEELGARLQDELTQTARDNDLLIVGPNCMGIYNPRVGIRFSQDQPAGEAGNVGFISQSGTHGTSVSLLAAAHGIRMSKVISIGNSIVLDAADCLEYFLNDPETEVIGMYVEGVRDGRRFFEVLREATRAKPVVIWKGGRTAAGARASRSHTASLASSQQIWQALARQTGALLADDLDELIDLLQVLLRTKPGTGKRIGLMAMTGGQSVVISDAFASAGLEVPRLEQRSYDELATFFNIIGGSYQNPFDMAGTIGGELENLTRLFRILEDDANVDAVCQEISAMFMTRRWTNHPEQMDAFIDRLRTQRDHSRKPFLAIMHPGHLEMEVAAQRPRFQAAGIAVLPNFERAARALNAAIDYHRYRAGMD